MRDLWAIANRNDLKHNILAPGVMWKRSAVNSNSFTATDDTPWCCVLILTSELAKFYTDV
jgi:hypothetical protein